jgi:hypothetical protein
LGGQNDLSLGRQSIDLTLFSQTPRVILKIPSNVEWKKFPGLSSRHQRFVNMIRQSPQSQRKILFCGQEDEAISKSRIITAVHFLEEQGFQVETGENYLGDGTIRVGGYERPFALDEFDIIVMANPRIPNTAAWRKDLLAYVQKGGSLYLSANHHEGPHNWWSNRNMRKLHSQFGVTAEQNVFDPKYHKVTERYPRFQIHDENHDLLKFCQFIQSKGMSSFSLEGGTDLLSSSSDATPEEAIVMSCKSLGQGRLVMMGDSKWMLPHYIHLDDNAQLFSNIFQWLSRQDIKKLSSEDQKKYFDPNF